jgi:tRNA dimethylallyltransferase
MNDSPLVVIVGPTASGKTALAIRLAKKYNGEIVCADSRTVYKGLDIGTAKPSVSEQQLVRHHLIDVVEPDDAFTVADFKVLAVEAIDDIANRGKLPILVGGSGLYVDAVVYDFSFSDGAKRDESNPRHAHVTSMHTKSQLRSNTLMIGIKVEREMLTERINTRVKDMIGEGLVQEVRQAITQYPGAKALLAPGYRALTEHIAGSISLEQAMDAFVRNDYQLARRQMTWFKRNKSIHWIVDPSNADDLLTTFLNKKQ